MRHHRRRSARLEKDGTGIVLRRRRGSQSHEFTTGNVQSLAHRLYAGQVGRPRHVRRVKMVQRHAIVGQGAHSCFDRCKMTILADFRSFAGQQIFRRVNQVIGHPRFVNLRKRPQRCRRLARFLVPVAAGPIRRLQRFDELHWLGLCEIVDVRLPRQAAKIRLLPRISLHRFFEGLIGRDPQVLPQRIVIAIDSHGAGRSDEAAEAVVAYKIRAVQLVAPDTRFHVHEAVPRMRAGEQCAEFRDDFAHLQIEQSIFDVVRPHRLVDVRNFQFQARLRAGHLIAHGFERVVVILRSLRPRGPSRPHRRQEQNQSCYSFCSPHCMPPVLITSCAGAGRMGGRSVELSFFCTSNSEVKIAGDAAATGTDPDSAPQ